jgi:hypothetical protein
MGGAYFAHADPGFGNVDKQTVLGPFAGALSFFGSEVGAVLLQVDLHDEGYAGGLLASVYHRSAVPRDFRETYASRLPWCLLSSANASSVSPAFSSTMPPSSCTFRFSDPYCSASFFACDSTSLPCSWSANNLTASRSGVFSLASSEDTSFAWPRAIFERNCRTRTGRALLEEKDEVSKSRTCWNAPA